MVALVSLWLGFLNVKILFGLYCSLDSTNSNNFD